MLRKAQGKTTVQAREKQTQGERDGPNSDSHTFTQIINIYACVSRIRIYCVLPTLRIL